MAVLDTFTRANENPLNPANWGGDIFGRASHALGVASNKCVNENAGAGNSASGYWLALPSSADHSVTITVGAAGDANYYYLAYVRLINPGTANVSGYYVLANGGGGDLLIYRMDNGAGTLLLDTGVGWSAGDAIEISANGTTIAAFKNNVLAGSAVDATYAANGNIAVLFGPGGSTIGQTSLTLFEGNPFGPVNTVAPAVTGTTVVGQALTTTNGTWTGSPTSYAYQWQRDNFSGGTFSNIASATASSYTLVDADDGCKVRCVVTATSASGSQSANSNQVGAITEPAPVNTVAPAISGSITVGSIITVGDGTWSNMGGHTTGFAYQWQDSPDGSTGWANISGQTGIALAIATGENTKSLRCRVTATNSGSSTTASSTVAGPVSSGGSGGGVTGWNGGFQPGFTG